MATRTQRWVWGIGLVFFLGACTDGRVRQITDLQVAPNAPHTSLIPVKPYPPNGGVVETLQMVLYGNSLFLTGKPFGFIRLDVDADAENPTEAFNASEEIMNFAPFQRWVVDWYASGALAVVGSAAFMSGQVGLSVVDLSMTQHPREVQRYPIQNQNPDSENVVQDVAYVYKALVSHPTLPILYGFSEQDYLYTLRMNSQSRLELIAKDSYGAPGTTVCCVQGATSWNGMVFIAFQSKLVFFEFGSDGKLKNPRVVTSIQAVNVASTAQYLYVQHQPTYAQPDGMAYPAGIYVFDLQGNNVAFLAGHAPLVFAVAPNNAYLYANEDNQQIQIYRINWVTPF